MLLKAAIHLGKKRLYMRFTMREAVELLGFAREPKLSDVLLDRVERADAPECFKHALSLGGPNPTNLLRD